MPMPRVPRFSALSVLFACSSASPPPAAPPPAQPAPAPVDVVEREVDRGRLVLYDAKADLAYWLYTQRYFRARPGFDLARAARVSVAIPVANVLDRRAMRTLAGIKNRIMSLSQGVVRHDL